jgi:hypothetical protein
MLKWGMAFDSSAKKEKINEMFLDLSTNNPFFNKPPASPFYSVLDPFFVTGILSWRQQLLHKPS